MELLDKLSAWFREKERVVVAYSGGVDSSLLLAVGAQVLGDKIIAVTVDSPLNKPEEKEYAQEQAKKLGVRHIVVEMNDLANPLVRSNPEDRCYHCKKSRFENLIQLAKELGTDVIVEGSNIDDLSDYRPGLKAVEELHIYSPLQELGFSKKAIRELARALELDVWDKPSEPCLATRIPFNTEITSEKLDRLMEAEKYLKENYQMEIVRVRDHHNLARIEVAEDFLIKIIEQRKNIITKFKGLGYRYVTLDMLGYQTGSMNEVEE